MNAKPSLSGPAESLLIPLYIRAMETQRPDALIHDDRAVELVNQLGYDFGRMKLLHLGEANKLVIVLRSRQFDRCVKDFLARHRQAVVVHIGCGLDSRFERVDNGLVAWYDLDLADVIDLRRKLIGQEGGRYHLLACSALEETWLSAVSAHRGQTFLFVAEGVFMYFVEAQVKGLVRMLRENFPGAELVFDCFSPIHVLRSNLQTASFGLHLQWGICHGQEVERWGEGIRLLDEWGFFDCPDSRLESIRWMRPIEALARTIRIYHFQLGDAEG